MFKLPGLPSISAEISELADFAELESWAQGTVSKRDIIAALGRFDEYEVTEGADSDEDRSSDRLDEVMAEIENRAVACSGGYPFELEHEGTVLRHKESDESPRAMLYRYLLLSTRLNMTKQKVHGKIDGALLLEEVAASALKQYLGGARASSFVFGTAAKGGFAGKVNHMCRTLKGRNAYRKGERRRQDAVDGGLDVVAWVPFSDGRPGQLILFGQCKTGTSWNDDLSKLVPDAFMSKWMTDPFHPRPLRVFCLSESAESSKWRESCIDGGLIFDRCRLVDFGTHLESELLSRISKWTIAAKKSIAA